MGCVEISTVWQWTIWLPLATWKSIMLRPLETAGPWDRYESAQLLSSNNSPFTLSPLSVFVILPLPPSFTPLQVSVAPVIYVCYSPSSPLWYLRVIRHSITFSVCVCVLCVLVWKRVRSRATVWRGLRQTAVRQEGVCTPLQWCLCTLSQRGECHWSDAHTHTHKHPCRVNAAVERLSCLRHGE